MNKEQLLKFVKVRNKSAFPSNLQFTIDAESCGFQIKELGQANLLTYPNKYEWNTPFGKLIEEAGTLRLEE